MNAGVFAAVLGAAFLHAFWNALIKQGANKLSAMLWMTLIQGIAGLGFALSRPWPATEVIPWLLASGAFHAAYKLFLTFAYEQGDLSRVYPIARGAAPMVVLGISAAFLSDVLSAFEVLGVLVLGLGIVLMARGAFFHGEQRRLVPLALGSAMMTAGYSLVDGLGARVSGDAVMYVGWLFFLDAVIFTPICLALRGTSVLRVSRGGLATSALAAAGSYGAYAIAVWAMTVAPIALVAALRETSILFAVLIGWLWLKDRMDLVKAASAGLIICGALLTRI